MCPVNARWQSKLDNLSKINTKLVVARLTDTKSPKTCSHNNIYQVEVSTLNMQECPWCHGITIILSSLFLFTPVALLLCLPPFYVYWMRWDPQCSWLCQFYFYCLPQLLIQSQPTHIFLKRITFTFASWLAYPLYLHVDHQWIIDLFRCRVISPVVFKTKWARVWSSGRQEFMRSEVRNENPNFM